MAKLIPKLGVNSKPAGECLCPGRHAQADGQPENIIPPAPYIYDGWRHKNYHEPFRR